MAELRWTRLGSAKVAFHRGYLLKIIVVADPWPGNARWHGYINDLFVEAACSEIELAALLIEMVDEMPPGPLLNGGA